MGVASSKTANPTLITRSLQARIIRLTRPHRHDRNFPYKEFGAFKHHSAVTMSSGRRFAPLKEGAHASASAGPNTDKALQGIVFDVDGTLWLVAPFHGVLPNLESRHLAPPEQRRRTGPAQNESEF